MDNIKVRMTIPNDHPGVHDGTGGIHFPGSTPTLNRRIAEIFVQKRLAEYSSPWPARALKRIASEFRNLEYPHKIQTLALLVAIAGVFIAGLSFFIK